MRHTRAGLPGRPDTLRDELRRVRAARVATLYRHQVVDGATAARAVATRWVDTATGA